MKRQSEEIEDLKQQVKQSKKYMDQSMKYVQSQPISQSAPTAQGSDGKPVVDKIERNQRKAKTVLRCHSSTTANGTIERSNPRIEEKPNLYKTQVA